MPLNQISVANPATTNNTDGATVTASAGRQGDTLVSEVHGKWYSQAYRGNVFHGSTLVAGTIIPISTATAATFVLYNPLGSGVNLELIAYELGISVVTVIASPIGLGFASSVGGSVAIPTSVTTVTPRNGLLGAGKAPQAQVYTVATLAAATTYFKTLFNFTATNATAGNGLGPASYKYDFDGTLILPPGTLIQTCGLVAPSTSASTQDFVWAEVPV